MQVSGLEGDLIMREHLLLQDGRESLEQLVLNKR